MIKTLFVKTYKRKFDRNINFSFINNRQIGRVVSKAIRLGYLSLAELRERRDDINSF